ncbi:ferritin-like domain-containing protein [Chitinophaga nivalis]|uniref:Ferritin-like protein n=1 Tax=Chitinophaga nivalis TaxID=2991709 RepID=A0ABT3IL89_9BACT|nr:ferritin-like protein [Chitinophaga nivalis]MCW3465800.1 ferritin-like protein [Chitinophaga nivalis]MCW3484509.1 ferritin-like protein [Chitinophaga nivalis]
MQRNFERYLGPVFQRAAINKTRAAQLQTARLQGDEPTILSLTSEAETVAATTIPIPPEFNGKDYVSFLVQIDAEIEHGLMLQYLYAAYSLGGPQIPDNPDYRDQVRKWQEIILGIAKEEMGHFVSVQNVLKLLGAPLHFERQDYPWDTPFYPFPFKLEKLTLDSLAKYVYAEAPQTWLDSGDELAEEIKQRVKEQTPHPNTVGALFEVLLQLIKDPTVIADDVFQADTYPYQAKFDEWGRGYAGGQRGNTLHGNPVGSPDVLVVPLASRDDAYNALHEIAEQGEASDGNSEQPSHFERFKLVYIEMRALVAKGYDWAPARDVATNPEIAASAPDPEISYTKRQDQSSENDKITNPDAQNWGHLFNIRYRLLLNFLSHSFLLDDGLNNTSAHSPRGVIINGTFGEMYNLRAIATVMVQLPLHEAGGPKFAGPPFLTPYTLSLPSGEHNRWRTHKDLIIASATIIETLLLTTHHQHHRYLYALQEADKQLLQIINELTDAALACCR